MSRSSLFAIAVAATLAAPGVQAQAYGLGKAASAREIAGWDIDVRPDGKGLPPGSGTASRGKALFEAQCAACHGMKGEGGLADRLVGGRGTLNTDKPVMTVGSFWPYATTLYDYINRAMPFMAPQSLKPDEVYAITAYVLFLNGIVGEQDRLDAATLPRVKMPNHKGFVSDPRPDMKALACEVNCK
ncbi:MAG: cytochrome c [Burkholderiales bacterium]|nr:cytochrome c [Burkholderiales bacterium]